MLEGSPFDGMTIPRDRRDAVATERTKTSPDSSKKEVDLRTIKGPQGFNWDQTERAKQAQHTPAEF